MKVNRELLFVSGINATLRFSSFIIIFFFKEFALQFFRYCVCIESGPSFWPR